LPSTNLNPQAAFRISTQHYEHITIEEYLHVLLLFAVASFAFLRCLPLTLQMVICLKCQCPSPVMRPPNDPEVLVVVVRHPASNQPKARQIKFDRRPGAMRAQRIAMGSMVTTFVFRSFAAVHQLVEC
jgi:hypothetical protein